MDYHIDPKLVSAMLPVTVATPTYGRFTRLRRCVDCFLKQDYPGNTRMIILNDAPEPIHCELESVEVINKSPGEFDTLGEKRQWILDYAETPYVAHMDDDDLYLPWYLTRSMLAMRQQYVDLVRHKRAYRLAGQHEDGSMYCRRVLPGKYEGTIMYHRASALDVGGYDCGDRSECDGLLYGPLRDQHRRYDIGPDDPLPVAYAYRGSRGDSASHVGQTTRQEHHSSSNDYGGGELLTPLDATPYYQYVPPWSDYPDVEL